MLEQVQAQMGCYLENAKGNNADTRVSPLTRVVKVDEGIYQISMKAGSYLEILPGYELVNCYYKLIVLGRTNTGKALLKDVYLIGTEHSRMESSELEIFSDKESVSQKIEESINPLIVFPLQ